MRDSMTSIPQPPESQALVGKTYHVLVFGCQMNLHDAERVSGLLSSRGCIEVSTPDEADIVVFMTCCVREKANTRLYGQLSAMVSAPTPPCGRRIVCVGGCIAQTEGDAIRAHAPNVDVVFGTAALASLPDLIISALGQDAKRKHGPLAIDVDPTHRGFSTDLPSKRAERFHAWVPIMTGCNNFCTYCIVPYARGREVSREFDQVVGECQRLAADGVREICLLGQNVNSYGRDRYGEPRFAELLRAVGATGIERIRFTSSHPKDLSDETIAAMAETPAVMPALHLAVQSGSTRILKAMNRHYSDDDYRALVARIRAAMPDIALSTDLIVGFPGETEEDFAQTLALVEDVAFDSAFTFIYSPRPGTPAARMHDDTPHEVIQERFERLAELVARLSHDSNQQALNTRVECLVEGSSERNPHVAVGHSRKNRTVLFDVPQGRTIDELVGKLAQVEVAEARTWYLRGSLVGDVS